MIGWSRLSLLFALTLFLGTRAAAQTTIIDPTAEGGFELGSTFAANGWTEVNATNGPWTLGTLYSAATPFSNRSAYISLDGGVTSSYNSGTPATTFFYRDVTVPAGEPVINLTFNWFQVGESSWDIWQVFYAPTSVVPVASNTHPGSGTNNVPTGIAGATYLGNGAAVICQSSNTFSVTLPQSLAGTTFRLIFGWKSDTSVGGTCPAAIDNISLTSGVATDYTAAVPGGLWNSPASWVGGVVPPGGNNIIIPAGSTIVVNQNVSYGNVTVNGKVQWITTTTPSSTVNTFTAANITIGSTGEFLAHAGTNVGAWVFCGGDFINDGFANFAATGSVLNMNATGGAPTLGGTGTFLPDKTGRGMFTNLFFNTLGAASITTTQDLVTGNLAHTAGSLNTNNKLSIDNHAMSNGGLVNRRVSTITVNAPGSGYTSAPTVTIAAPPAGGTTATAVADWDAVTGTVRSITITDPGNGYRTSPTVTFSGGGGTGATAIAHVYASYIMGTAAQSQLSGIATFSGTLNINSDQGVSVAVTNGGTGYTSAPTVGVPLPTAFLNLVTNGGSGYTSAPTVTFNVPPGGTAATGTAVVTRGQVTSVNITGGGTNYTAANPPVITLTGGGGTGATAAFPLSYLPQFTATIDPALGMVTQITTVEDGFGYLAAPTILLTGGGGTGATTTARAGIYNMIRNWFLPAASNAPHVDNAATPANRRMNALTLTNSTGITFTNNLTLYAAAPLTLTGPLDMGGNTLAFDHPSYAGTAGSATNYVTNGSISYRLFGSTTALTRPFPFQSYDGIGFVNNLLNMGSATTVATEGSTITLVKATYVGAPSGANAIGNRALRIETNGGLFGNNPSLRLTWNSLDNIGMIDQQYLYVGQSAALTGPWNARSNPSGTGPLPASGNRTTATTAPGPIVSGEEYFAWNTTLLACAGTPPAGTITGAAFVCGTATGTTLTFNTTPAIGLTYQWASSTSSTGPFDTLLGTGSTQATGPLAQTTYFIVTSTCSNGGETNTSPVFEVEVRPVPTASATNDGPGCVGNSINFDGTTDIGTDYSWTGPNSFTSSIEDPNIPSASTASAGTYTFIASLNGCNSAPATTTLVINPPFTIQSISGTPNPICSGGTTQLSVVASSPLVNAYAFTTGIGADLDPMVGATQILNPSNDDSPSTLQPIGFTLSFNGQTYTQWSTTPDGFIKFGSPATTASFGNGVTLTTNLPKVYSYWEDVATGLDGNVKYVVTGTAPNRILKVQWFVTVPRNLSGNANATHQCWIYEDGTIEFRYGTMGSPSFQSASLGMTGSATNFQSITVSSNTSSTTTANNTNADVPGPGRFYRYSPNIYTYSWTPAANLSDATIANPVASGVTSATTFAVTVTDGLCPVSGSVNVEVGAQLTATINENCAAQEFTIDVDVASLGSATGGVQLSYTVDGGTPVIMNNVTADVVLGPFGITDFVELTSNNGFPACAVDLGSFYSDCTVIIDCNALSALTFDHCYSTNDPRTFVFTSSEPGTPVVLKFLQPSPIAAGDGVTFFDGDPLTGTQIPLPPAGSDLSSLGQISSTGNTLSFTIQTNASGSCEDGGVTDDWTIQVRCAGCQEPEADVVTAVDCPTQTFSASVDLYYLGFSTITGNDATSASISYTVNGGAPTVLSNLTEGIYPLGSHPLGAVLDVTILHQDEGSCNNALGEFSVPVEACPNDGPCEARPLVMNLNYSCGNTTEGSLDGATASGVSSTCTGTADDDVWFVFTATAPYHRIQILNIDPATTLHHALFTGNCGTLTLVPGSCATGTTSDPTGLTIGQTYYVQVYSSGSTPVTTSFDVCVSEPPVIDMQALNLASPSAIGCYGAAETVAITIKNNSWVTIDFSVNPTTVNASTTTGYNSSVLVNSGTLAPGATLVVTMPATIDMSLNGTYTFNASTSTVGEEAPANDAMPPAVRVKNTATESQYTPVITSITATPPTICAGGSSQLNVVATVTGYGVINIPHAPLAPTGTTSPGPVGDDAVSLAVPIGFPFTFNGNTYTSLYISTNGFVSFSAGMGAGCCAGQLLPNTAIPNNLVALGWRDLNTNNGGNIDYFNLTSPNRMVIRYNNVAFFSGVGSINGQIILYADGTIEVHSTNVNGSGTTTQGIENANGTEAWVVPGRNASNWIATNDAYRFVPNTVTSVNWSPAATLSDPTIANPIASPVTTTSYTAVVSSNGCTNSGTVTVTVEESLAVTVSSTATTICAGVPVTITATPTGGGPYSYSWAPGGETTQAITVSPSTTTQYTVTVSNPCGATATASVTINVNPTPTATAVGSDVCSGQTLNLTGVTDIGTTFQWTGPNGFSSTLQNPSIPNATFSATGTYTFIATLGSCPSAPSSVAIQVQSAPTISSVTATPPFACTGGSTQLNVVAMASLPNVLITEITLFRTGTGQTNPYPAHITGQDFVELNNASTVAADVSGWTVSAYASNGTTPTHSITFPSGTVIPPNGVAVVHLGTGTNNASLLYFNTGGTSDTYFSGGLGGFLLRNGSNIIDAVATNGAVFNAATGVTASNWSGSATSAGGVAGVVRTAPNDSNTGADWTTAATTPQTIGTYNPGYNNPNTGTIASYSWAPAGLLNDATIANPVASGLTQDTTFTVTVASNAGCTSTGSVSVTVGAPLTVDITASQNNICSGTQVTLTANITGGGSPYTYSWSPGGETTSIINVTPGITTEYVVTVNDGCGDQMTDSVTINVTQTPTATASSNAGCIGQTLQLTGGTDVGTTFSWTGPNGFTSTSQNPAINNATAAAAGNYTFIASLNGCNSAPSVINVSMNQAPVISSTTATPAIICPGGTSQLQVTATLPTGTYCIPTLSTGCTFPDIITNVTIAGINRTSTCDNTSGSNGYSLFTTPTGSIVAGSSGNAYSVSTGGDIEGAAAWIDYNRNGVFEASENIFNGLAGTNPATYSGTFSVPAGAFNGTTRMRVRCMFNVNPGAGGACTGATWGETEDYLVTITGGSDMLSYLWNNAATLNDATIAGPVATPSETTIYTVTATSGGCSATGQVTVTVDESDTDGDGFIDCVDNCPNIAGQIGDTCDPGPGFINGVITSDCQCVGEEIYVDVLSRVMLDGAYNATTGLMRDDLRNAGLIPTGHPYAGAPWNHAGTETLNAGVLAVTGNEAIVDWVLLELRDPGTPTTIISSRAALVQRDGDIVDMDGVSEVKFTGVVAANYHLVVKHRNHLGVMSASSYPLSDIPTLIDLTLSSTTTYGTNARRSVTGTFPAMTMWTGNANSNTLVNYSGSANDRTAILNVLGAATFLSPLNGYNAADVNMNGTVTYSGSNNDRTTLLNSLGASTFLTPIVQQLP